jgi:ABC-type multidrug transport system permease subunit/prefoldin subunit 5
VIDHTGEFKDYEESFYYLEIKYFNNLEDCLSEVKDYKIYGCLEIYNVGSYVVNVYYDNTREPVIWEIVGRIKGTFEYLQKERSKKVAYDFSRTLDEISQKSLEIKRDLSTIESDLDRFLDRQNYYFQELSSTKNRINHNLNEIEENIGSLKNSLRSLKSLKDQFYSFVVSSNVNETLLQRTREFNSQFDLVYSDLESKINFYESSLSSIKDDLRDFENSLQEARYLSEKLRNAKDKLHLLKGEIDDFNNKINQIRNIGPEALLNPINIINYPIYVPQTKGSRIEDSSGINLISFQTIYPIILHLMIIFLSTLVSVHVSLTHINQNSYDRIRLHKNILLYEIFGLYITSLIIILFPLLLILFLGNYTFLIPIIENIKMIVLLTFLISSSFVLLGFSLSFLIKNESLTLIVTIFVLVLSIFLSGFVLPIEKMSNIFNKLATVFPGKVSLNAFNKVVFYRSNNYYIDFYILCIWLFLSFIFCLISKHLRNKLDV